MITESSQSPPDPQPRALGRECQWCVMRTLLSSPANTHKKFRPAVPCTQPVLVCAWWLYIQFNHDSSHGCCPESVRLRFQFLHLRWRELDISWKYQTVQYSLQERYVTFCDSCNTYFGIISLKTKNFHNFHFYQGYMSAQYIDKDRLAGALTLTSYLPMIDNTPHQP